jgi:hypothetical protein
VKSYFSRGQSTILNPYLHRDTLFGAGILLLPSGCSWVAICAWHGSHSCIEHSDQSPRHCSQDCGVSMFRYFFFSFLFERQPSTGMHGVGRDCSITFIAARHARTRRHHPRNLTFAHFEFPEICINSFENRALSSEWNQIIQNTE